MPAEALGMDNDTTPQPDWIALGDALLAYAASTEPDLQ